MSRAKITYWLTERPPVDVQRAVERLGRDEDVYRIAVMPDVHLSKDVCVGVALATKSTLIPAAVGGDIGCGMAALAFDAPADVLAEPGEAALILARLREAVPVLRHRRSAGITLPAELWERRMSNDRLEATKRREAALQFGTLGRGNHFLEFQSDDSGGLWLMVHSGSRGMGQAVRESHEQCGRRNRAGLMVLDAESAEGQDYLADVAWALEYARLNREYIVNRVQQVMFDLFGIEVQTPSAIACHHNFVQQEKFDGELLWVHRKGAISAGQGELGIIPGSMGTLSFHVEGRGCDAALRSSSHGAGRIMSRAVARRQITDRQFHESMHGVWFDHRLTHRLLDEAPGAYKDIGTVMRAQGDLTKPIRKLRPVLVFKGG